MKRAPISREYVNALEDRVGALESLLHEINPAGKSDHGATNDAVNFGFESPNPVYQDTGSVASPSSDGSHWGGIVAPSQDSKPNIHSRPVASEPSNDLFFRTNKLPRTQ
jgi:hypothetical protein